MIFPKTAEEFPSTFFLILIWRNKDDGWGGTDNYWDSEIYTNEKEWKEAIIKLTKQHYTKFKAARCNSAVINQNVEIL